jgi:hypothetical protein
MSKHPKPGHETNRLPANDLDCNPGIGSSKGTFATGEDPEEIEGENTSEGDTANRTDRTGAVRPDDWGRTNP